MYDRIVPLHVSGSLPASPDNMFKSKEPGKVEKCSGAKGKNDLKKDDEETTSKSLPENDMSSDNEMSDIFKGVVPHGQKKSSKKAPEQAKAKAGTGNEAAPHRGPAAGTKFSNRGGPALGAKTDGTTGSPIQGKAKKSLFPLAGDDIKLATYVSEQNPPEEK